MILTFEDGEDALMEQIAALYHAEIVIPYRLHGADAKLQFAGLEIDPGMRIVKKGGREAELTATEFNILLLLAQNPGIVFSKEKIYSTVWQEANIGDCSIIMNHIHNIREKIGDSLAQPVYIQTVWGVGYRFNGRMNGLEHG